MGRRLHLVAFLAAASTAFASGALCVRSYWHRDYVLRAGAASSLLFDSNCGRLSLLSEGYDHGFVMGGPPGWSASTAPAEFTPPEPVGRGARWDVHFCGFACSARSGGSMAESDQSVTVWNSYWEVRVPHVAVVAAASLAAAYAFPRWRAAGRGQRRRRGLCESCGYDVRATPDRCPECGAAATAKPAA